VEGTKKVKMTKYDVVPFKNNNDYLWAVFELPTEQVIDTFYFEEDANALAKTLDRGRGFAGWTPAFLLTKVVVKEDINQKFSELVLSK
jgi:hypothetical protein